MIERFRQFAAEQHLFPDEGKVLLAVSGGRDSVCMAHLMHCSGRPFAIAHCNFHLRPGDCDRDELFVRRLAKSYQVPYFSVDFDTEDFAKYNGMGIEEAARVLRYRWFAAVCQEQGYSCVAVAHHRDDSAETLFLNLFRGTGIAGMHGIRPQTVLYDVRVVRPMLCFSRNDIDNYVGRQGLEYVEDATNSELKARRNRIRNELMPRLRVFYPSIDKTLASDIRHFNDAEQIYDNYISLMRGQLVKPLPRRVPTMPAQTVGICIDDIPQPRATILFELLRPYGVGEKTVNRILSGNLRTGACFHTPTHDVVFDRGTLVLGELAEPVEPVLSFAEERFSNGKPGIFVDADCIKMPCTLRLWKAGDRIYPFGFNHSRKVSDVLKDLKLSLYDKRYVWVLVDAEDRIVWIVGLVGDQRFHASSRTTRVLHICLEPTSLPA